MNNPSGRSIEPRQVIGSWSSIPISSSTSLITTSNSNAKIMGDRVLYPKITPGAARDYSSSSDLCPRSSRDSSSAETLGEAPVHDRNDGRGHRRVQRQPHTKSRTGCLNCKRRRIKCEENRPSCTQCAKRRLQCEWPDLQFRDARAAVQIDFSSLSVPAQLQSTTGSFTMQDFRLFYNFIDHAYPHHPLGNDSVWTHEIPSISHNYDYLMHAMLGLSASDLKERVTQTPEITCSAMSHRLQAIKSLNKALSDGLHTFEEGNAMLATCYALLFQSVLLEDGLAEYMSFIRGCILIAQSMGCKRMKFLFHSVLGTESLAKMDPHLKESSEVNPGPVDAGCRSLEAFEPLCQRGYQRTFHASLLKMARALYTSSRNAYISLMELYAFFSYGMSHEDFQHFIDPENEVGQLLQSHFVAVQLLLTPITIHELGERKFESTNNPSIRWFGAIFQRVTPLMREFYKWPMSVEEGARTGLFYTELTNKDLGTLVTRSDDMTTMALDGT